MELFTLNDMDIILGLSKNPNGLTEVFNTIKYQNEIKDFMFILNDYAPDGKDTSWIWDANFNELLKVPNLNKFYCVGTRAEEIALRLKYTNFPLEKVEIYHSSDEKDIKLAIDNFLESETSQKYIIGTFTAMPEARKILINKIKEE